MGTDFAAGGVIRKRAVQKKRTRKALSRKPKLKWWRRQGGDAREIARGGAGAELMFGAAAVGVPLAALRARRRLQAAACRVSTSGASLTARLAIGGDRYGEADLAVLEANPPLGQVLALIWDQPRLRQDIIDAWLTADETSAKIGTRRIWRSIRGPVSAAYAHLLRIGAEWTAPFTIRLLDNAVNILATPPSASNATGEGTSSLAPRPRARFKSDGRGWSECRGHIATVSKRD